MEYVLNTLVMGYSLDFDETIGYLILCSKLFGGNGYIN